MHFLCPEATLIPVWKTAICKWGVCKRGNLKCPVSLVLKSGGWIFCLIKTFFTYIFLFLCFIMAFITIIHMFDFTLIIRNTFCILSKRFSQKFRVSNGQHAFITYELNAYDLWRFYFHWFRYHSYFSEIRNDNR